MSKLLDILLQRNDAAISWGFRVSGGRDFASQPIISTVISGTLASQYLNAGDKLIEIERLHAETLLESEINGLIENGGPCLQVLVEKRLPARTPTSFVGAGKRKPFVPEIKNHSFDTSTEQECVKVNNGMAHSTKIWMRETNKNGALGEYDFQVNFQRTKYKQDDCSEENSEARKAEKNRNRERMKVMSENFDRFFREKIGEWIEGNMFDSIELERKQQSNMSPAENGSPGIQAPPPPPPPSLPGVITGRRIKTEIPERSLEPPAAIQNAMMTKDKKPFTYTPGGIDLSEIRSPRMARRINRNAQADEMPGIPAPTTNHHVPVENHGNTNYSAMQSQLPSQVLPPVGASPPPPPPPPPPAPSTAPVASPAAHAQATPAAPSAPSHKPMVGKPALPFDPNELFARVNKSPAYEPSQNHQIEPPRNFRPQPPEEKPAFLLQQRHKSNDVSQNKYAPAQNEPAHVFAPPVSPKPKNEPGLSFVHPTNLKTQNEPGHSFAPPPISSKTHNNDTVNNCSANQAPRGHVIITRVPPSANNQETCTSPSSPFGSKIQRNACPASPSTNSNSESKPTQAPWVTIPRTQQTSVPWANREPETPKASGTRIIPIQMEGRDLPKSPSPSVQTHQTPPPFMQSPQARQQFGAQQVNQTIQKSSVAQQTKQPLHQEHQSPNTRIIPIQIEGGPQQQPRSPTGGILSNKFNSVNPQSPTPYSPSVETDQKPQWASVQPRQFRKESENVQKQYQQQQQPQNTQYEYNTYNTAGVPLSQLRKMQLSDDDRALMDKFKHQVELHGNDILNDENTNPRYKGGYIPSKVFKMLDESVDEEMYLHNETDPRYRGAAIPSRAFRILQCMTDTAGDMQQQVPTPPQSAVYNRTYAGPQNQEEPCQGPYVPPSEQQVQEPRKYTGGSIPSRSFRMLQAMTGQELSAPNSTGPSIGRDTPVSGVCHWCSSPSPSPIPDQYWPCYYPPDPCLYNYISRINAAYGFPPPPPPFAYPRPLFSPHRFPHSCVVYSPSDSEEQGYSSTDELAQYYNNYRKNFGCSPCQANLERSHPPTPIPFMVPRCPTPGKNREAPLRDTKERIFSEKRDVKNIRKELGKREREENFDEEGEGSENEVEKGNREEIVNSERFSMNLNNLLSLKSVTNMNFYKECSRRVVKHYRNGNYGQIEDVKEEEEEDYQEDAESTSESFDESEPCVQDSRQLSVIFEEPEHSDMDSIKRRECSGRISVSESCSTVSENDFDEEMVNSSVVVRLPLRVACTRLNSNLAVTTVIVGKSAINREPLHGMSTSGESNYYPEEINDTEGGDVSVTFTIPSRSNSILSVENNVTSIEEPATNSIPGDTKIEVGEERLERDVETEVTVYISRPKKTEKNDASVPNEKCESPQTEDESSSTTVQSDQTILDHKEDSDTESEKKRKETKERNEKKIEGEKGKKTGREDTGEHSMTMEHCGPEIRRQEELTRSILEMVEVSKSKFEPYFAGSRIALDDIEQNVRDLQEESEEDDSGVTSDMSLKLINSETEGDIESDYGELLKMTKYQRASTHSRLYNLLQEECRKSENGETKKEGEESTEFPEETLAATKERLTLPLYKVAYCQADGHSSSSVSLSTAIDDRVVKELVDDLLKMPNGKKFEKLPAEKLFSAAKRSLLEEMLAWEASPSSADDGFLLSPTPANAPHSSRTAELQLPFLRETYGENYNDYLNYFKTWNERNADDYDIVPSKTFKMLQETTNAAKGFKVRCPRVASKKDVRETSTGRATPAVVPYEPEPGTECLGFSEKREIVSKVLEKLLKI